MAAFACLTAAPGWALAAAGWVLLQIVALPYFPDMLESRAVLHLGLVVALAPGEWLSVRKDGRPAPWHWLQGVALLGALLVAGFRHYPVAVGLGWSAVYGFRLATRGVSWRLVRASLVNGLLVAGSVAFACVGADLFARYALGWGYAAGDLYTLHPIAYHTHNPGGRGAITIVMREGPSIEMPAAISRQGLREDREYGPKAPDEYRILLLGDSFTQGHGVEVEETVGRRMETLLTGAMAGKRVTVINGGVGAYAPWQSLVFLRERCLALEPDLVIHQIFAANDVDGMLDREEFELAAIDYGRRLNVWTAKKWREPLMRADIEFERASALYAQWLRYSNGERRLSRHLRELRFFELVTPPSSNSRSSRSPYIEAYLANEYPELTKAWALLFQSLRDTREVCERDGIGYAVYGVPHLSQYHDEQWDGFVAHAEPGDEYDRWKDQRLLSQFCADEHIPFIDVASPLRDGGPPLELYFEHDGHLTAQGCDIVAAAIADWVRETLAE